MVPSTTSPLPRKVSAGYGNDVFAAAVRDAKLPPPVSDGLAVVVPAVPLDTAGLARL